MHLNTLVVASNDVASLSGRLDKIRRLSELLVCLACDEIEVAIAFLSGQPRQGRIGLGWAALSEARATPAADVASLDLAAVDEVFQQIAGTAGAGSTRERGEALRALFERATAVEQDFLVRLLAGELRQGALEGVLVEAVARAAKISSPLVRRAAMLAGDLQAVARAALIEGEAGLSRFVVQIFCPVQPMLADSADTVGEALGRLGSAALEFKLDGARVQVHKAGDQIRIFSRNLREVTPAVPEVLEQVAALPAHDVILDGEVIALRPDGTPHPFQMTMRRFGRRLDVERLRRDLPLTPFFFDCLYLDGHALIDEPQHRRFAALIALAPHLVVPHTVSATVQQATPFQQEALRRGHEGIVAKALDASYAAGRRGQAWLKIKVARTLDLVVLGAEWGHGRRRGWLSNLHLGARDSQNGGFVMLGKTFKGLTDEMLAWQTDQLLALATEQGEYLVRVRPELVVEIAFNDLQESPRYPGGLALRFARVKAHRTDKSAAEADTFASIQEIFRRTRGREPPASKAGRRVSLSPDGE